MEEMDLLRALLGAGGNIGAAVLGRQPGQLQQFQRPFQFTPEIERIIYQMILANLGNKARLNPRLLTAQGLQDIQRQGAFMQRELPPQNSGLITGMPTGGGY